MLTDEQLDLAERLAQTEPLNGSDDILLKVVAEVRRQRLVIQGLEEANEILRNAFQDARTRAEQMVEDMYPSEQRR